MLLINFCKRNNIFSCLFIIIVTSSILSACGLSGERGGTNGQTSSNGGGNDNGGGLGNDVSNIKERIGITVEPINGTPNNILPSQITIVTLNENFREVGSNSVPSYQVDERLDGGTGYEIQFNKSYIEKVNQVVKVTFNNNSIPKDILYAPLYTTIGSEKNAITVNAKSHYLLKKLFDAVDTPTQLTQLLPCPSSVASCANQAVAKSNMLQQINQALDTYTISIPNNLNIDQAINLLEQQLDLRQNIESAVAEITRDISPFAKGTKRSFNAIDTIPSTSQYFHSILFGLSFSDLKPNDNNRAVNISSLSSTTTFEEDNEGNLTKIYPSFNQSSSLLDMRRDVLSGVIPYIRTSLEISQNNIFSFKGNQDTNRLASSNNTDSFLSTQGFLLNERAISQKIFNVDSATNRIGWEFNPFFSRAYQTNEYEPPSKLADIDKEPEYGNAPTWLTSSNYSKAASYKLFGTKKPYERVEQLEDMHIFSWEVHGLETKKDPGFSISSMSGKEYGAITYSLKLTDNSEVMQLIAETAKWDINSGQISISQPSSHYQSLTLSRNQNNATQGVIAKSNLLESPRSIFRVESDDANFPYQGLISLDGQGSGQAQGHSTANGSYLALAFNTQQSANPLDRGQGIILASELVSSNYTFSDEVYQLQGNSMEITAEKNIIHQLNGSKLEIKPELNPTSNDCTAELSIKRTSVEHTVGALENTLSLPIESLQANTSSQVCTVEGSELLIEFPNIFNETLTLRGFITHKNDSLSNKPGNLINLIWQQDNQLGLVFTNKEQDLSPTFNE